MTNEQKKGEKISIVIPAYNIEKYIKRCVRSVLNQTYQNLEIIIVNDGSTDNTKDILNSYNQKNIKVIHQRNSGVYMARLNGIKHATGSWIGFVDGDDEIEPHMYENLMNNAISFDAQISHCGYKIIYNDMTSYFYGSGKKVEYDQLAGVKALLIGKSFEPSMCNKLYRRELFDMNIVEAYCNEKIGNMEDLLLNYYLFKNAQKTVFEDNCWYHYIKREGSASLRAANKKMIEDILKVYELIREDCDNDNKEIINARIVATLTKLSMYEYKNNIMIIDARQYLRDFLRNTKQISRREKYLGYMIVKCPYLYLNIYKMYRMRKLQ